MTAPRFLQLHFLASYPGALLNRDDAGLAKRLPFGGATRTRVSSQCLKRHWRMADDAHGLHRLAEEEGVESERSKVAIEREVTGPLRSAHDAAVVGAIEEVFVKQVYGANAGDSKKRQALLLGRPELNYLAKNAARIAGEAGGDAKAAKAAAEAFFKEGDQKANLKQFKEQNHLAPGLESALFGRMVTSDTRANTDAAIHVAHAFTVHDEQPELDYFTVVDDLAQREDAGAAGIFDTELTSGLYYGYVVVDLPLLVSNLTGAAREDWAAVGTDRDLAARVVENLVHLVATVSPGAKKGSTAPYAYADLVLAEMGARQPRTLANAFRDPVRAPSTALELDEGATLLGRTTEAMAEELADLDGMFGAHEARAVSARGRAALEREGLQPIPRMPLDDLATRLGGAVRNASSGGLTDG